MFVVALSKIGKTWKQPKCPSDELINEMWYIHTVEYYSTIKRFELLLHITTWMNLENIMESERSQLEKITYSVIPII